MRVLLVDDEPLIVEGLQRLIEWEEIGCKVIGTALDGSEALACYSELPCDLVITDIRMHQCDGLELIRQWKNIQPSTRWVVLSGFQDFEYVRSGLKLGIENYLLKPVDDRELVATIAQVKRKREHEQKEQVAALILRDNAIWRYLTGEMGRQQYEERMQLYRPSQSSFFRQLSVLVIPAIHQLDDQAIQLFQQQAEAVIAPGVCCRTPENDFFLLTNTALTEEAITSIITLVDDLFAVPFLLVKGECEHKSLSPLTRTLDVASAFKTKRGLFNQTEIVTQKEAMRFLQQVPAESRVHYSRLQKHLTDGEVQEAKAWAQAAIVGNGIDGEAARRIAAEVILVTEQMGSERSGMADMQQLFQAPILSELLDIVNGLIEHKAAELQKKQEVSHVVLQEVLAYVDEHVASDLSLKQLGQRFFINPIYLGQLFQREMGVSFSEYINQKRIALAKQLLTESRRKAGEIAKDVGYADATYFYKQFKKKVGVTPNEFRHVVRLSENP